MLVAPPEESWTTVYAGPERRTRIAAHRARRPAPGKMAAGSLSCCCWPPSAAGGLYFVRARPAFGAVEVQTVTPSVQSTTGPMAGTPILTASGYLVARRQSVVSSKIQGRISELAGGRGQRREDWRRPGDAGKRGLRGRHRQGQGRYRVRQGRPGGGAAAGASAGGPVPRQGRLAGRARRRQSQGRAGRSHHRAGQGRLAGAAGQSATSPPFARPSPASW